MNQESHDHSYFPPLRIQHVSVKRHAWILQCPYICLVVHLLKADVVLTNLEGCLSRLGMKASLPTLALQSLNVQEPWFDRVGESRRTRIDALLTYLSVAVQQPTSSGMRSTGVKAGLAGLAFFHQSATERT